MPVPVGDRPRDMFIKATFALAKRSPAEWAEFLAAFVVYTDQELEQGVGSTSEIMAVSVGMNRRMVNLRNDFRNIESLMEKVSKDKPGVK